MDSLRFAAAIPEEDGRQLNLGRTLILDKDGQDPQPNDQHTQGTKAGNAIAPGDKAGWQRERRVSYFARWLRLMAGCVVGRISSQ